MTLFNNKKRRIILAWLAVCLWMLLIFYFSAQVADDSNKLSTGITQQFIDLLEKIMPGADFDIRGLNHFVRKNAHFFVYFVLGVLVFRAVKLSGVYGLRAHLLTLTLCIVYAISDEIHQHFVPGRGPQVKDVMIDSAGALVGIICITMLYRFVSIAKQK